MVCVLPLGHSRKPDTFRGCVKLPWLRYEAGIQGSFSAQEFLWVLARLRWGQRTHGEPGDAPREP